MCALSKSDATYKLPQINAGAGVSNFSDEFCHAIYDIPGVRKASRKKDIGSPKARNSIDR